MNNLEEAKEFLRKDIDGSNLYDHISDVLLEVLTKRPGDALGIFEQISSSVKQAKFIPSDPLEKASDQEPLSISTRVARTQYCKAIKALYKFEADEDENEEQKDEDEEPLPAPRAEVVEDIVSSSVNWDAAGVCFSKEDTFKLMLAMARLAGSDDTIQTLRFWGKLQGRSNDYFVVEGVGGVADDTENESIEVEANKHNYWVCSFIGGPWFRLPMVTPAAVICAQRIKKFLTGSLQAAVSGYPPFPGNESDYVRAIIALINADCLIAPRGYFKLEEDGTTVGINEDFENTGDLSSVDAWQRYCLKFNSIGRVTAIEKQDEEGNTVIEPDNWVPEYLSACDEANWSVRRSPKFLANCKSERIVLRSNRWPGAYAISSIAGTWSNIYIGFGIAASDSPYTPPMPPSLQEELHATELLEQEDVREDPTPEDTNEDTE